MSTTAQEARPSVPIATATVLQGSQVTGPFVVEELSPSGITLRGPSFGTLSLAKASVLLLPRGAQGMLRLEAVVTHSEWRKGYCIDVSLRFHDLAAELQDQIQDMVTQHLERTRLPMTIVLDTGRLEEHGLRRTLHALGREAVFAQNSLDALWFLERFRDYYSTILIDQSFIASHGPETLLFLHDQYLDKRRVLALLRETTPRADPDWGEMSQCVHGVLTTPWTVEQVESALGVFPAHGERSKRILFVDDEPAVLSGLQQRLRKFLGNVETVWVTSGEVALAESQARPFDVVVSDLRMPGMDGMTLLRAIKGHAPHSKRIVLSGTDLQVTPEVADVVLHKPCGTDQLRAEVLG